jgi:CRISPR-associated endonuclease/helicase Cas3
MMNFGAYFEKLTSHHQPHQWQIELASKQVCSNRLIRIPTGFGKTLGILATWLWHRVNNRDESWPRRLVWCLPMRVLVEQTEQVVRNTLNALGLLWKGGEHTNLVGVHLLMGGVDSGEWHLHPEQCAVLIGTQDLLLSRAMNRGYAAPRARWPMEFGLLNVDCLWVMDEVQLMDVGLATSSQMQTFREDDSTAGRSLRPCCTWWMSATLQQDWLTKSPDTVDMAGKLSLTNIPGSERQGHLWDDIRKTCRQELIPDVKELPQLIVGEHCKAGYGAPGPTLVVVNRVDRAVALYEALCKGKHLMSKGVEIKLVHSRFRPVERASWLDQFLNREACAPGTNRIIVATQVVEAGVDISAGVLISELAPWASLVQRFGRCARWGGDATVIVFDTSPKDDKAAAPYSKDEIDAAREALQHFTDVSPTYLESFEEAHTQILPHLYPFEPKHLLLRHELEELFDTTPDLSGADIDVSRFIRSGEERDLHVFWAEVLKKDNPPRELRASREALCAVPFLKCRDWLCGKETSTERAPRLKEGIRAWVWDWLDGRWRSAERRDLYPGQTVLVETGCGGYLIDKGWAPDSVETVIPANAAEPRPDELADASQDDETLSASRWQTIAVHGRQTGATAKDILRVLAPGYADLFEIAGRWHDAGKVHPAFNNSIGGTGRPERRDLAKAPKEACLPVQRLYPMPGGPRRAGFRHELASALALIEVLKRHDPDHPALLGPWRALLANAGMQSQALIPPPAPPNTLEQEILRLNAGSFNLAAYLICAHHGKIRLAWHACPADQASGDELPRIRGLQDGDLLPPLLLATADHTFLTVPQINIDLGPAAAGLNPRSGPSWTERVLTLLSTHGPFTLAWLEALLRAADQRASRMPVQDELLEKEMTQ